MAGLEAWMICLVKLWLWGHDGIGSLNLPCQNMIMRTWRGWKPEFFCQNMINSTCRGWKHEFALSTYDYDDMIGLVAWSCHKWLDKNAMYQSLECTYDNVEWSLSCKDRALQHYNSLVFAFTVCEHIVIRVQWFFFFENETHTVVPNYLRTPIPNYDPLKLCFSIWGNLLKVWLFSSFILSIWISLRQWHQRRSRDKSAGSARTFSWETPAIAIVLQTQPVPRLKRCKLPPLPAWPGPAWTSSRVRKMARPALHLPVGLHLFQTIPMCRAGTVRGDTGCSSRAGAKVHELPADLYLL